jgi:hypothetical protein
LLRDLNSEMRYLTFLTLIGVALPLSAQTRSPIDQDWSHYVRIAGHGLSHQSIPAIIEESQRSHVFGIEVDNDVPGRYESFLKPDEKLDAIRKASAAAHAIGNKSFVYIAGLECITAHGDKVQHSFFKDHPDWVQRDRSGKPAVFGGGTAFWITKGDEDVWISPYAQEWRSRYMRIVRQIAATGIDGVYVDIPYWMTHFDGWEDSWASFDHYTVEAFRKETGIDALHDMRLGDTKDPHFRKWVDFRISSITAFMREIDQNVKAGNPKCLTIAEIFPGFEKSAPVVGSDVYDLYPNVDVIAHEYHGPGESIGASRPPFDWIGEMIGMFTFRSFAGMKATWMLNYSWDGEKQVNIPEAMKTQFAAQLTAGVNSWDAKGHVMSGSNDLATRTQVYAWIEKYQRTFYDRREPIKPIGIYFSPSTRNHQPEQYVVRFRSAMELLVLSHREFRILTPRDLSTFAGSSLLVPGETLMDQSELESVRRNVPSRVKLFDPDAQLSGFEDVIRKQFLAHAEGKATDAVITQQIDRVASQIPYESGTTVHATPFVVSQVARVDGKVHVFLMNFSGVVAKHNLLPEAAQGTAIEIAASTPLKAHVLPFLGAPSEVPTTYSSGKVRVQYRVSSGLL